MREENWDDEIKPDGGARMLGIIIGTILLAGGTLVIVILFNAVRLAANG